MDNFSIKTKLLSFFTIALALIFFNIFIFTAFINANNKVFKETIYEQVLQSTQLILNADRDFYQAYNALEELTYNESANKKALIEDYSENAKQVYQRVTQAKEILEKNKKQWEQYESETTGQNLFEEFDEFYRTYDKWVSISNALVNNKVSFSAQKKAFDVSRAPLDTITNTLDDGTRKKIDEIEKNTRNNISLILLVSLTLSVTIFIFVFTMINKITSNLGTIIKNLTDNSDQMHESSEQLSEASHNLASGTVEQAAAIQETSATIEETSSMVQQNNDNTKQAAIMAKNAKHYASMSNDEMDTMMQSMSDLRQSSNEIAKIIKVIDEIAFQTNLLSLNAAVEAAHAGDAGKGFAVVAEEVRNLAKRSAQAAKDTASIIENNISLSEQSVAIAINVNEALEHIDIEAKKVSELLEEISAATEEQSRGVGEINKAIQQIEQVMQVNSLTAEESSSASNSVADQASKINEIVYSLIKLVNGANIAVDQFYTSRDVKQKLPSHRQILPTIAPRVTIDTPKSYEPKRISDNQSNLINWNDSYSVGVVEMDNQHKQLVTLLNDLYAAMQSKKSSEIIGRVLNKLISYTEKHFSDEEDFMKRHSYPGISGQMKEHEAFTDKVKKFKNDYDAGRTSMSVSITSFLKDWLVNHISISDKKYGDYVNGAANLSPEQIIPLGDEF